MERLGLYKSWITSKILTKKTREVLDIHGQEWEKDRCCLQVYSQGGNPFFDTVDKTKPASPPFQYKVAAAINYLVGGLAEARLELFGREDHDPVPALCKGYGYSYWRIRIEHHSQIKSPPRNGASFTSSISALAGCLYCGWLTEAERLAREILILYQQHRFFDVRDEFSQPIYHWILRICFDYWNWEFRDWGWNCYTHIPNAFRSLDDGMADRSFRPPIEDIYAPTQCFGEPVLNELFAHWRDADLAPLSEHLIWLCDYYTHRTRAADGTEFGNDLLHTRFPATILAWFRLREQLGLQNPVIEHPLMQPAYVGLPERQPSYTDDLLEAVLARLRREEIPDLGEMPKDPVDALPPKRSWLGRLLGRRD